MKMQRDHVFGIEPNVYMLFRSPQADFPAIFNVTGDSIVGNGSGFQQDAIYSAYGEYIERYHFYYEVDCTLKSTLAAINSQKTTEKLKKLIQQIKKVYKDIDAYEFSLAKTKNIFTSEAAWLPSVMISLGNDQSQDRTWIPFTDSCGQACHVTQQQAFFSALNEFIERQALVGSWLSGKYRHRIAINCHEKLGQTNSIIKQLQAHGTLYTFEINNALPGYAVIIFYFSNSTQDIVRYSVGMAADSDPVNAIARAVNELWQSYTFMYLNAENPESLDTRYRYLNELIAFNKHETKNIIPYFKENYVTLAIDDYLQLKKINNEEILLDLQSLSTHIFSYERCQFNMGRKFYFCKILSPDFFLHMGIQMPLNLDNPYAQLLGIQPTMAIKHPIPFP